MWINWRLCVITNVTISKVMESLRNSVMRMVSNGALVVVYF